MSNERWHQVWQAKGRSRHTSGLADGDLLVALMELNGYHSATSSASLSDHEVQFRYIVEALGVTPDSSVYEVGCGAGALLFWLRTRCAEVGGADFAASLLEHARTALPGVPDLRHCPADKIDTTPRYDVVLSNGVFLYFPDADYARVVVERMIAKARRSVGILDVNDADRRAEFELVRRAKHAGRSQQYAGLRQLYLPREFFQEIADRHGLRCLIEDSPMPNSVNARFRYHVSMFRD